MIENDKEIFYVIYSPDTCKYFMEHSENPPEYLKTGYYISAIPLEFWNIKFKGTEFQCWNVLRAINMFVYN